MNIDLRLGRDGTQRELPPLTFGTQSATEAVTHIDLELDATASRG
jgi:hypothetical protein